MSYPYMYPPAYSPHFQSLPGYAPCADYQNCFPETVYQDLTPQQRVDVRSAIAQKSCTGLEDQELSSVAVYATKLGARVKQLELEISSKNAQISQLSVQMSDLDGLLAERHKERDVLEQSQEKCHRQIHSLQKNIRDMKEEKQQEKRAAAFRQKELSEQITLLRQEKYRVQDECTALQKEIVDLKTQTVMQKGLLQQMRETPAQSSSAELDTLKKELQERNIQVEQAISQFEESKKTIVSLEAQLHAQTAASESRRRAIDEQKMQIKSLQKEKKIAQEAIAKMQKAYDENVERVLALEKNLAVLAPAVDKLKSELKTLGEENRKLRNIIRSKEDRSFLQIRALEEQLAQAQRQNANFAALSSALNGKLIIPYRGVAAVGGEPDIEKTGIELPSEGGDRADSPTTLEVIGVNLSADQLAPALAQIQKIMQSQKQHLESVD